MRRSLSGLQPAASVHGCPGDIYQRPGPTSARMSAVSRACSGADSVSVLRISHLECFLFSGLRFW